MRTAHVLLVEDNEGDILLTTEALGEKSFIRQLSVVRNGKDALDYIFQEGGKQEELPDFILLDINLPVKNGLEVLKAIRENEHTKHVPVIILTTSSSEKDQASALQFHADAFITKPMDMDAFDRLVNEIELFWRKISS
jgi:CheY-like chemotaxis protein